MRLGSLDHMDQHHQHRARRASFEWNEPKVRFTSMKSLAEVLSDKNRALLRAIAEMQPESLQELTRRDWTQAREPVENTEDVIRLWVCRVETRTRKGSPDCKGNPFRDSRGVIVLLYRSQPHFFKKFR